VNGYYEEQQPSLFNDALVDPLELDTVNVEQNPGFGLDGLRYCLYVLMRATMADFADSTSSGAGDPPRAARSGASSAVSSSAAERWATANSTAPVPPKKRAAKRRYRARLAAPNTGRRLTVVQ